MTGTKFSWTSAIYSSIPSDTPTLYTERPPTQLCEMLPRPHNIHPPPGQWLSFYDDARDHVRTSYQHCYIIILRPQSCTHHSHTCTYLHVQIDLFTTPPLRTQKNGPTKLNMCTRVVVRLGGCLLGWSVGGCAPVNALRTDRYSSVYRYLLWSPVKRNQLSLATKSLIGEWGRRWWSSSSSFTRLFLRHHRPESLFRVD